MEQPAGENQIPLFGIVKNNSNGAFVLRCQMKRDINGFAVLNIMENTIVETNTDYSGHWTKYVYIYRIYFLRVARYE